jgi:hypothetical protein
MTGFHKVFAALAAVLVTVPTLALAQTATGAPRQLGVTPSQSNQSDSPNTADGTLLPPSNDIMGVPPGTATGNYTGPAHPDGRGYNASEPAQASKPIIADRPARTGVLGHQGAAGVEVNALGSVEGPPAGLMDATNGGLGSTIWSGSPRGLIADLMGRMPAATAVSAMRALSRRLLLTRAEYPIGESEHALSTLRLQKLLEAGFLNDAGILAANLSVKNDPEFARTQAEAILYAGHARDACSDLTATRLNDAEPFWVELRAYCYAAAGDDAALDLTRAVMQARGIQSDAFDTLLDDAVHHKSKDPGTLDSPNAVKIFLLGQAGLGVDADIAANLGTPANALAMRSEKNDPQDRARAAEKIVRSGAASPRELIQLADAQVFKPDELQNAASVARAWPFFKAIALLRQAATAERNPARKAVLIVEGLRIGMQRSLFEPAAAMLVGPASALSPDKSMRDGADLIARAFVSAGQTDIAARWYGAFASNYDNDRAQIAFLQMEIGLAQPNPANNLQAQDGFGWLTDHAVRSDDPAFRAHAALAIGLYAALGLAPQSAHVANKDLVDLQWPGRRPAAVVLRGIASAKNDPTRKGEALLQILNAIGAKGPGDVAPDVMVGFVSDLRGMGLGHAAHQFALSAMLLYAPSRVQAGAQAP